MDGNLSDRARDALLSQTRRETRPSCREVALGVDTDVRCRGFLFSFVLQNIHSRDKVHGRNDPKCVYGRGEMAGRRTVKAKETMRYRDGDVMLHYVLEDAADLSSVRRVFVSRLCRRYKCSI